jgi:hypothetical protein
MATAILVLQQAFYASHLLDVCIIVGAIVYVSLIRLLKAPDQEDYQLLKEVIVRRRAKNTL